MNTYDMVEEGGEVVGDNSDDIEERRTIMSEEFDPKLRESAVVNLKNDKVFTYIKVYCIKNSYSIYFCKSYSTARDYD